MVIIHFDPPTEFEGIGHNVRACDQETPIQVGEGPGGVPRPWDVGTGDPRQVNCPECKATAAYKAAQVDEDDDEGNTNAETAWTRIKSLARS